MYEYPVQLDPADEGGFVVTFPDLPFGVTEGEDEDDALARAEDLLETILSGLIDDRATIPSPSPAKRRKTVSLPFAATIKVALYEAMRAQNIRKVDLGRRLGWHTQQIDRILDLRYASKPEQLEAAMRAVGKRITIAVRDAA